MKLLQIGRDRWTVLVVADHSGSSDLLTVLQTPSETNLGARMLALLREYVLTNGAPRNKEISKDLGGGRFEFRRQPSKGAALRVLDDTMAAYEAAKRHGRLEIRPWNPAAENE